MAVDSDTFTSPLFQLNPTNVQEIVPLPPPALKTLAILSTNDPAVLSLTALDKSSTPKDQVWELPTTESISGLDVPEEFENDDIDVIVERVKVSDILKEAEDLVADEKTTSKAIEHLEAALDSVRHNESKYAIYHQIGIHHYADRNFDEASVAMELALEHQPGDPALIGNLSAIYLFLNRVDDALSTLAKVSTNMLVGETDRKNRQRNMNFLFLINFNYACAYSMKKQNQEALAHLEMAARYDPISTLTSIGDVQLDNVRQGEEFQELKKKLELLIEAREGQR
ncbi:MAG: tetratricopeptide (TPR) repeat protein [Kiritimatiellia bacterium]|jgi:tetratricopeptide (TPR) repeat protein